jgi:hypothetical protein
MFLSLCIDLYIPIMAIWTYCVLIGIAALARSGPTGGFKPEVIYNTVSAAIPALHCSLAGLGMAALLAHGRRWPGQLPVFCTSVINWKGLLCLLTPAGQQQLWRVAGTHAAPEDAAVHAGHFWW